MKLLRLTLREQQGDPTCPYFERWVLSLGVNRSDDPDKDDPALGSIRLHHWFRSDDKRYKHDHPSDFITLVLKGSYTDLHHCGWCKGTKIFHPHLPMACPRCNGTGEEEQRMTPGCVAHRTAEHTHTVCVDPGGCWTLLYFFPERRKWGFWVPRKSDGRLKFKKANKYFLEHGHHPCDQP